MTEEPVRIVIQLPEGFEVEARSLDNWLRAHPDVGRNPDIRTVPSDEPSEDMDGVAIAALVISAVTLVPTTVQAVLSFLDWQQTRHEPPPITLTSSLGGYAELVPTDGADLEAQAEQAAADLTRREEDRPRGTQAQ
ncbi:effector-associated constant component EACC1 [Streptomyces sp. NPDC002587]